MNCTEIQKNNGMESERRTVNGERNSLSSRCAAPTKILLMKSKILLGLALLVMPLPLPLAHAGSGASSTKGSPATLTGKIIFVDKPLHALAVEVRGKVLQINVLSRVKITRGGKVASLEDLAPGQEVTVVFTETADGRLEVASLSVDGSSTQAEAAKQDVKAPKRNGPPDPFPGNANPANIGGGPHSPHH